MMKAGDFRVYKRSFRRTSVSSLRGDESGNGEADRLNAVRVIRGLGDFGRGLDRNSISLLPITVR